MRILKTPSALPFLLVAVTMLCWRAEAADYRCKQTTCTARIMQGGQMVSVTFQKDEVVSTAAGWVVNGDWTPVGS